MIQDVKPIKEIDIISKNGKKVGIKATYRVKGGLPVYGESIGNRLNSNVKKKLNELFK